jgi:hypothetical protein
MIDPLALKRAYQLGMFIFCLMQFLPFALGVLAGHFFTIRARNVSRWWLAFLPKKFWEYFE